MPTILGFLFVGRLVWFEVIFRLVSVLLLFFSNFMSFLLVCFYAFVIFPELCRVICIMLQKSPINAYFYAEKAQLCYFMLAESNYAERIASIRDAALKHFFLFACSCRVFQIVVSLGRGQGAFGSVFVFEI